MAAEPRELRAEDTEALPGSRVECWPGQRRVGAPSLPPAPRCRKQPTAAPRPPRDRWPPRPGPCCCCCRCSPAARAPAEVSGPRAPPGLPPASRPAPAASRAFPLATCRALFPPFLASSVGFWFSPSPPAVGLPSFSPLMTRARRCPRAASGAGASGPARAQSLQGRNPQAPGGLWLAETCRAPSHSGRPWPSAGENGHKLT